MQGHRGHFFSTLATEAIRAGVTVRLNTEVVEYWDLPTCPAIVTASGEVVEADVLLVADGVGGAARELLAESFGRTTGASIREGYSVWRGAVSNEGFLEDEELWGEWASFFFSRETVLTVARTRKKKCSLMGTNDSGSGMTAMRLLPRSPRGGCYHL